jgi:hypothetical protein
MYWFSTLVFVMKSMYPMFCNEYLCTPCFEATVIIVVTLLIVIIKSLFSYMYHTNMDLCAN